MHGLGKMGPEWAPLALTTRCMESKKDLRKIKGMRPVSNLKINENNVKCLKDYVDFIVNTQLSMQSSRTEILPTMDPTSIIQICVKKISGLE